MKYETGTDIIEVNHTIEKRILQQFKSNKKFTKRTTKGIAKSLNLDESYVNYLLSLSVDVERCKGCKGDMWTLKE